MRAWSNRVKEPIVAVESTERVLCEIDVINSGIRTVESLVIDMCIESPPAIH